MIIFIRIVLIYFIIGCLLGLLLNWEINVVFSDRAKWLNRIPKDEGTKKMILYCVFLWPLCLGMAIYIIIKDRPTTDEKITNLILDDDFFEEES